MDGYFDSGPGDNRDDPEARMGGGVGEACDDLMWPLQPFVLFWTGGDRRVFGWLAALVWPATAAALVGPAAAATLGRLSIRGRVRGSRDLLRDLTGWWGW